MEDYQLTQAFFVGIALAIVLMKLLSLVFSERQTWQTYAGFFSLSPANIGNLEKLSIH